MRYACRSEGNERCTKELNGYCASVQTCAYKYPVPESAREVSTPLVDNITVHNANCGACPAAGTVCHQRPDDVCVAFRRRLLEEGILVA